MGSLDSRGVYIYDVDDSVAPMHTLLNLGQASVSSAIDDAKQEAIDALTPDKTGWYRAAFLNMTPGWKNIGSPSNTGIRRYGDRVHFKLYYRRTWNAQIGVNRYGNMNSQIVCTLRGPWQPPIRQPLGAGHAGRNGFYHVRSDGGVVLSSVTGTTSIKKNSVFSVIGTYFMDW